MAKYNGHKNWNFWNVSLWLNNDEGLYRQTYNAAHFRHRNGRTDRDVAAKVVFESLRDAGIHKTPDGAPYTIASIRAAMVGM